MKVQVGPCVFGAGEEFECHLINSCQRRLIETALWKDWRWQKRQLVGCTGDKSRHEAGVKCRGKKVMRLVKRHYKNLRNKKGTSQVQKFKIPGKKNRAFPYEVELRTEGRYLNLLISSHCTSVARRAERAVLNWVKRRISSEKIKQEMQARCWRRKAGGDGCEVGWGKQESRRETEFPSAWRTRCHVMRPGAAHLIHTIGISENIKCEASA